MRSNYDQEQWALEQALVVEAVPRFFGGSAALQVPPRVLSEGELSDVCGGVVQETVTTTPVTTGGHHITTW